MKKRKNLSPLSLRLEFLIEILVRVPAIETCFMSIDEIVRIFLKSQSSYIGEEFRIFLCPKASENMKKHKGNTYERNLKKFF